ncbi:MAG: extracellular solute-binding protein [Roseburia sp.]|nr:extracellular solute-binding protein [Roseburia sp.]
MKKKVLSALLCASMVATMVAGCGGNDENAATDSNAGGEAAAPATEAAADDGAAAPATEAAAADPVANLIAATDGTVSLELWCSETDAYQTTMAELVEGFKAQYPDVDFDITIGAVSEADAKDRVLEDVEAAADVFVFADDQVNDLVTAGALQSVDATFTYDPTATNSASTVEAASKDGKLYAYPLTASNGYFLYYNSEVFTEEDVQSWESLTAAAEAANKKVGMDVGNGWYLYGFFAGAGCNLTMNDDQSNTCDWNNETGVAVAESIQNIASSSAFISVADADAQAMLPDGDLAAYVSGTWDSGIFEENYGAGYAATKLPTFDVNGTATQMGSYAGYKFVGVSAYSEFPGWSMLLAEYLTSEDSQAKIAEATGEGPANTAAAATITSPALSALAAQAEFADQQVVGGNFWDPAASLGASLVEGTDDVQGLLDTAVEGITQPVSAQ